MFARSAVFLGLATLVLSIPGGEVDAAPIGVSNGATQLNVTSFGTLTDIGVTVAPGGTAEVEIVDALPSPIVFYDVTAVDLVAAQIFHEGALLDLSTTATVSLANFIVDAGGGVVLADVTTSSAMLMDVAVLDINKACSLGDPCIGLDGTVTIEGLELTVSDAAGGLLAEELDIPNLAGAPFAVANSSFTPVPEPGTALLGLVGLALFGTKLRRAAQAQA